jgi:hypothetical protein
MKIYMADCEAEVDAEIALEEIDLQYLQWGWNTDQTVLDLVEYAKSLKSELEKILEEK